MIENRITQVRFAELPRLAKVGVALTLFHTWVLFAELVIDRYGLWEYMPFYRVAHPCVWDVVAAGVSIIIVWPPSRKARATR